MNKAYYHLPGLFEFYDFYKMFLPIYRNHPDFFYDWCDIGSIYGSPDECLWGGGRVGFGSADPKEVLSLMNEYNISSRLTFSNSLLQEKHLSDYKCDSLCRMFTEQSNCKNGIIIHSDLLMNYIKNNYPDFYFVSSTTKVITDFNVLEKELNNPQFKFVVPDFRLNKDFERLEHLTESQKSKVEFLCNECCWIQCKDRKKCYENVSRKNLGENCQDHICRAPDGDKGYIFSRAMKNPSFITIQDIQNQYLPMGFEHFKIEGRSLGSALILEFILYYMTKPEHQLELREMIYLDSSLDLF